jgi:integrase/recombinase XerD
LTYQYKREPLSVEEADRLLNAAQTVEEKLCVWGLLETGLRVSELASLNRDKIQWQQRAIRIEGKGGPFGKRSKRRVIPLSDRLRVLFEHYFALHEKFPYTPRTIQRIVKVVANRARISKKITPHVLRHTFSILWIYKNGSTRALQSILGHDHLSTTEIYLNTCPERNHLLRGPPCETNEQYLHGYPNPQWGDRLAA